MAVRAHLLKSNQLSFFLLDDAALQLYFAVEQTQLLIRNHLLELTLVKVIVAVVVLLFALPHIHFFPGLWLFLCFDAGFHVAHRVTIISVMSKLFQLARVFICSFFQVHHG